MMIPHINIILSAIFGFLIGLLIGLAVWLRTKSTFQSEKEELRIRLVTLEKEREADADKIKWIEQAEYKMRDAFASLARNALVQLSRMIRVCWNMQSKKKC